MTHAPWKSRERDLRRTVERRRYAEARTAIAAFCDAAVQRVQSLPPGGPQRRICLEETLAVLEWARRMTLTGMNQLWVADITYIRLQSEFVYLALVLDAFSRKVIGWALERTLRTELPLAALRQALEQRQPPPGLVHHSDRGLQ